ncbi:MAG: DEAD/DEAH box helicase [Rhodocyclales bacterium GWA2_65_20]|nr:MAG: DEAD/DEAH box helicase [Rhodocyclales bacterium GWA2_65_20]
MPPLHFTEDTLVQQTTADYLRDVLGWEVVFAYNDETFGSEGTLGRRDDREVVLTRYLGEALVQLNPGLPDAAYREAQRRVLETTGIQSALALNREKYELLKDGVSVAFHDDKGELVRRRLRVFDFDNPANNRFLAVRELWVRGDLYRRRADIVGFVNGLPLLFMELKNLHKDIRAAFDQNYLDYRDTVPHLFHHNAFVLLANGVDAKIGALGSRFEHFHEWKRLEEAAAGAVDMETLLKGVCDKANFLDLFENFIVFDDSTGKLVKIVARNHQFLGVNRAVQALRERAARLGRLGVFWHTQGSGKSYSIVFFTRKVHRRLGGNYSFLVLTDRDDLDNQIYKTFAGCGVADNDRDPCRAADGEHLKALLGAHKPNVFSLIQKFNQRLAEGEAYSRRDDIVVITDEAHRTQYGLLARNLRDALPNAAFIGFTGTPLFKDDEITRRVFGDYVSTYDFQRAVDDKATVPLYYDARGEKLHVATSELNVKVAEVLEKLEVEDVDVQQRLERELKRDYHVITADRRLEQIAADLAVHYSNAWESGKALLVCIDKITCLRMLLLIEASWQARIAALEKALPQIADQQEAVLRERQLAWMRETRMAVVVSEEQGEVDKFRKWGLDITPHRRLIKEGFELPDGTRLDVESAFKREEHPFRVAIVCAMWLTGFDVPSLATLYLDKPLKAHTLMQAIARANRVHEGKNNGLVVDYCGILKSLRQALATFVGSGDGADAGDPARPEEELLEDLREAVALVRGFLAGQGFRLDDLKEKTGFALNAAIVAAKEAVNENDRSRKRYEVLAREMFKKFKACVNNPAANALRDDYHAINAIYKSLQKDREAADISDVIRQLQRVVDGVIETTALPAQEPESKPYDISKIDFDRLRKEFERSAAKRSAVQNLKQVVEARLARLLARNPLRTDFQQHYEGIVDAYNREKDRLTIEQTFEALFRFVQTLNEEESRAAREGLDEESLALFDILRKPELDKQELARIKKVAGSLLETLKVEKLRIAQWREKEATRDEVQVAIRDFLWDDSTGLPVDRYSEVEVMEKAEAVFRHVYRAYPTTPSPYYGCSSPS